MSKPSPSSSHPNADMIDFNQLVIFYHLARSGSFVRAEEFTGFKQSWISRQIKELEETLNNKLFDRNYGSVSLTPAGESLLEHVEKIMFEARMIKTSLTELSEDLRNKAQGHVKIATTTGQAAVWIVKYVKEFMDLYPDMRLTVVGRDERVDLSTQDADVMIRPFVPKSPDLVHVYLSSYPLALYASQSYLDKYGTPKSIEDLEHHRLIGFSKDKSIAFGPADWHLSLGCNPGEIREPFFQVNSAIGLIKVAQDGLGIISVSQYRESAPQDNLVQVLPDIEGPMIDLYYIYPKRMAHIRRITVLAEFLIETLEKEIKSPNTKVFRRNID
jgi:DNA-binding transcriptional LysR family regulator